MKQTTIPPSPVCMASDIKFYCVILPTSKHTILVALKLGGKKRKHVEAPSPSLMHIVVLLASICISILTFPFPSFYTHMQYFSKHTGDTMLKCSATQQLLMS